MRSSSWPGEVIWTFLVPTATMTLQPRAQPAGIGRVADLGQGQQRFLARQRILLRQQRAQYLVRGRVLDRVTDDLHPVRVGKRGSG